jgi:hypothetical protein
LRPFDASRLTTLDDVDDRKPCIDESGIHGRMRICALAKRLTGGVDALDAILVLEVDATLFHGDQQEAGVAVPTGIVAGSDNKILEIHFRLPIVLKCNGPLGAHFYFPS